MFHPHSPTGGDPHSDPPDRRAEWQSMRQDAQESSSTALWLFLGFIIAVAALLSLCF